MFAFFNARAEVEWACWGNRTKKETAPSPPQKVHPVRRAQVRRGHRTGKGPIAASQVPTAFKPFCASVSSSDIRYKNDAYFTGLL